MTMIGTIAIVGANIAGAQAAAAVRSGGFEGRVVLIGEEPWRPYQRPMLSKEWLRSDTVPAGFELRDERWYDDNQIDLILGTRVEALDRAGGQLRLADSRCIPADRVLLATGARARRLNLPGADAANVHHLRTRADADDLRAALRPGAAIVVVGMGVIGAEVAASAVQAGCRVTAVEPGGAAMLRTLGGRFGGWLSQLHTARGLTAHYGVGVSALEREGAAVRAVILTNGVRLESDAVVVGIGVDPNIELAAAAGLRVGNGIVVDAQGRTSDPHVWAAGDVSNQPGFFGTRVRLETFQNAAGQADVAAAAILGGAGGYLQPCWFWSDQYDCNIQVAGRIDDSLRIILRGDLDADSFTAIFLSDKIVEGVLTVNRGADMAVGRRLVGRRASIDLAAAGDMQVPLRSLI